MNKWLLVGVLWVLIALPGCKGSKEITGAPTRITPNELKARLDSQSFSYHTLQAKLSISYQTPEEKQSFKGDLRVKRDSIIWLSIKPVLGLEVARVLITTDTVHMLNRLNKTYIRQPLQLLEQEFGLPNDFPLMQSLLIGNIYPHFSASDTVQYQDSTYRIVQEKGGLHQVLWVEPYSFTITGLSVQPKGSAYGVEANFSDYQPVERQPFSHQRFWRLSTEKELRADLSFSRVKVNNPLQFTFVVPEQYERVE